MKISPKDIMEYLNEFVVGQEEAKQLLAVAGFIHYLRKIGPMVKPNILIPNKKSNGLLIGPTGTGKTLLVNTLAECLRLPFLELNAASLSREGYVGMSVLDQLLEFMNRVGEKEFKYSIIFIDEIDKQPAKDEHNNGRQYELLKLIEGTKTVHQNSESGNRKQSSIDTTNCMFILAGNFEVLRKEREKRTKSPLGFVKDKSNAGTAELMITDELTKYGGIIPEIAGRISAIAELKQPTKDELYAALKIPNGYVDYYNSLLSIIDKKLEIEDKDYDKIVDDCMKSKIGYRGLQHGLDKLLIPQLYELT